jgi:putative ABC transport system permease protein
MVRGRYVALNGVPVDVTKFKDRERRLVEREFNLSFTQQLPAYNEITAGRWFTADDYARGGFSVEQGIARSLGWKLGDVLTWQVAGRNVEAPIVSIRKLDWDSMQVNFFVIATPAVLREAPISYITSVYLPPGRSQLVGELSQRFPNLTVVDVSLLLRQMQDLLDQAIQAVQLVFLFALAAGILVLYAALRASEDERTREAAVMRTLGAARRQVLAVQRAEFGALGLIAGLLAAGGATALGLLIANQAFQMSYQPDPWVWLAGPALGALCAAVNMRAGARLVLERPPLNALRDL